AEIGADQQFLQLLDRCGIELALGDQVGDRSSDRRGGPFQPAGEAGKPALFWGVIHAGRRDSGFSMDVKAPKKFDPKNASEEEILARVLHRDGLMLVIDKPAGLSVHRGPKGGPSLEDWFDTLRYGLPRRPELAHRLDRETSGCLVLGRHRNALAHLSLLFKHRRVGKTYWAVVEGGPDAEEGVIDMPLGRLDPNFGWWMKHDPEGQPAVTKWKVIGRSADTQLTWLALEPVTGR